MHADPTPRGSQAPSWSRADAGPLTFSPPLYTQRHKLVHSVLQQHRCTRVLEAGCGDGAVLEYIARSNLTARSLEYIAGLDIDPTALAGASRRLSSAEDSIVRGALTPLKVELIVADLTYQPPPAPPLPSRLDKGADSDGRPLLDAIISVEVLEHVDPEKVAAYTDTLFAQLGAGRGARVALLTTPNREANTRCEPGTASAPLTTSLPQLCSIYSHDTRSPWRRHPDHKFELTTAQFTAYCDYVLEAFAPYWVRYERVGLEDDFTQGAVFLAHTEVAAPPNSGRLEGEPSGRETAAPTAVGVTTSTTDPPVTSALFETRTIPWRWAREVRLARFPFAEIFGLDPTIDRTPTQDAFPVCTGLAQLDTRATQYTLVERFTRPARPLWKRLGAGVRDCLQVLWARTAEIEHRSDAHTQTRRRARHRVATPPHDCGVTLGEALADENLWLLDDLWLTSPCALLRTLTEQCARWAHEDVREGSGRSRVPGRPPAGTPHRIRPLTEKRRVRRLLLRWLRGAVVDTLRSSRADEPSPLADDDNSTCSGRLPASVQHVLLFLALTDVLASAALWLDTHLTEVEAALNAVQRGPLRTHTRPLSAGTRQPLPAGQPLPHKKHVRTGRRLAALFDSFLFCGGD